LFNRLIKRSFYHAVAVLPHAVIELFKR